MIVTSQLYNAGILMTGHTRHAHHLSILFVAPPELLAERTPMSESRMSNILWNRGIYQNSQMMGSSAVDLLIAGIQRNEPGLPEIPVVLQVEGNWHDRGSTPKRKAT